MNFLKRRLVMLELQQQRWLNVLRNILVMLVFQKVTSDAALQQEDNSQKPTPLDAKNFRSRIGLLLYLARDRVDVMYCMGQRACVSCQLCLRRLCVQCRDFGS